MSLGLSTVGWGWLGIREGEILIKRKTASREEHPFIFWTVTVVFHFLLGAILTGAGLWYILHEPALGTIPNG